MLQISKALLLKFAAISLDIIKFEVNFNGRAFSDDEAIP